MASAVRRPLGAVLALCAVSLLFVSVRATDDSLDASLDAQAEELIRFEREAKSLQTYWKTHAAAFLVRCAVRFAMVCSRANCSNRQAVRCRPNPVSCLRSLAFSHVGLPLLALFNARTTEAARSFCSINRAPCYDAAADRPCHEQRRSIIGLFQSRAIRDEARP